MTPNTQITPETVGMLKACPFCGGEASVKAGMGETWVGCNSCGAETGFGGNGEGATIAWNRRPAASSPSAVGVGSCTCHSHMDCALHYPASPTPAPSADHIADAGEMAVDWQVVGPKLVEALINIKAGGSWQGDAAADALAAATPGGSDARQRHFLRGPRCADDVQRQSPKPPKAHGRIRRANLSIEQPESRAVGQVSAPHPRNTWSRQ